MPSRSNHQSFLLRLALATGAMALAIASLLVFEVAQMRTIRQTGGLLTDSLTALVFQFEREFLRLRQSVEVSVADPGPIDAEALSLRYDIFLSRVTLLRDSPTTRVLDQRPEYQRVVGLLGSFVAKADGVMAEAPPDRRALAALQAELFEMGPGVQALSLAADSLVARQLEHQAQTMLDQSNLIIGLTVTQLLMLLVASAALVVRQRRQEAERLAMEKLSADLQEARQLAEAANRGKSQFLANMSHELRTPFNGLMGMLDLLEATPVSPQQADYIGTAQASADHLLALLNDILDVSAMEAGKTKLKPSPVNLPRLLQDVEALVSPQALAKGLAFTFNTPLEALPWVEVDATRLKQILFNLLSNAVKFTPQGAVSMTVVERGRTDGKIELAFEIKDTGIGIDAESLANLFHRFYQADSSKTRSFGGTGLGLEISQSLARMMGGGIAVQSKLGEGSVFTLRLGLAIAKAPAVLSATPADSVPESVGSSPAAADPVPQRSQPSRVLVVEDHPVNRKLMGMLLERMGLHVSFCENGQLALDLVQKEVFDAVFMDVNMPVMDGLTATRHVRALAAPVSSVPIIVFTADVMDEATERALAAGADGFLSKPVKIDELQQAVDKHLPGHAQAAMGA